MERVVDQLKRHTEQLKTLNLGRTSAIQDCEILRKMKFLEYKKVQKNARTLLVQCVQQINVQLHKYKVLEQEHNTNPNYPVGASAKHPTMTTIRHKQTALNAALTQCEQNEVMAVAAALEVRELSDSQCQGNFQTFLLQIENSTSTLIYCCIFNLGFTTR